MLQRSKRAVWLAAGVLAAATPFVTHLAGQVTGGDPVFSGGTRLVVLHASVLDKNGNLLTKLPKESFRVLENGVQQDIRTFRREDIPVSLGLIIDNSGSMRDKRQRVETAALNLVKASNPRDEVFIVNFNDEAYLDVAFTSDIKKMDEGLTRIDSRGGTAMRDAINMSIDYMNSKHKRDKKVLVVVTDGNDNTSNTTLEKLVRTAQQSEVVVYAVGLLSEEDRREAKKAKRNIDSVTRESGGLAYYPNTLTEVDRIATLIANEIRNQYTIAYSPRNEALDGTYRQIKVSVDSPGRPSVRTRSGYYATPDQQAPRTSSISSPPRQ